MDIYGGSLLASTGKASLKFVTFFISTVSVVTLLFSTNT